MTSNFSQQDLQSLLPQVVQSVLQAGEIILEQRRGPLDIRHKGPMDLVTQTDLAVEAFLLEQLGRIDRSVGFLGEESAAAGKTASLSSPTWVVDPVDGTTNYAHGVPFVATSVGLWDGSRMVLGVVNCPMLDECFFCGRGLGASLGRRNSRPNPTPGKLFPEELFSEEAKPGEQVSEKFTLAGSYSGSSVAGNFVEVSALKVSATNTLTNSLLATGFPYEARPKLSVILTRLERVLPETRGLRRCGAAAIDLAYVAAGRFDAYYEEWLKPWDTAAGWLLVEEAGGRVGDLRGRPYSLNSSGIIAGNPEIYVKLTELLK